MPGLFTLAIAPAIFLFFLIYAKDRYDREPLHLVLWIFFLGCLVTIPAALIETLFPEGIFTSSVVAPVVEETAKFLVVYLFIWRHGRFDEPADGIVYAMAAGLGFATVENIFYVLEGGYAVGILRALFSVPGHVIFSCIWGAALGIAKFRPQEQPVKIIVTGLLGAMILHGIFNFCVDGLGPAGLLVLLVVVPAGLWWTMNSIEKAHAHPASVRSAQERRATAAGIVPPQPVVCPGGIYRPPGERPARFCTGCGALLREGGAFCEQCGKRV